MSPARAPQLAGKSATVADVRDLDACSPRFLAPAPFPVANAHIGATVHTPFAVTSRATYGYWGSKFVVLSRMIIACFWLSINSYQGGQFVTQMIGAIWPSYFKLPNALGTASGTTTRDMLSFFLFWLAQLPLMFVHPSRLGWLFATKAVVTAVVCVGTLVWVSPPPKASMETWFRRS